MTTSPTSVVPATPNPAVPPAVNPYPSASLYVGDLASDVSEGHLFEIFNLVGPVASIRVCRDAVTRRSLGYAYVNFHNHADARNSLESLNNTPIKGSRPCRIMWSQRDPSARKSGVGNIFIKNLDKSIDHKALFDTFSAFGTILSCKVVTDETSSSKGYGFVHYETQDMAERAITKVNGMMLNEQQVYVGSFIPKKERIRTREAQGFTNVFVKNLDDTADAESLTDLFNSFGKITNAVVMIDEKGKHKGFGFVNYEKSEDAKRAVEETNGKEYNGRILFVGRAQKKAEREAELKQRFEQLRQERATKYQGVNLYIKNLDDDVDDEKLKVEFSAYGNITSAKVMKDDKGNSKGFGFVCFTTPDEATKAVSEMNGKIIGSKPLYVALAQRKETRKAQLEAQRAQMKNRGNYTGNTFMPATVYPPGSPPMFYGQTNSIPPQQFVYPQQIIHRGPTNRWATHQTQYQPMPNYVVSVPRQQRNNPRQVPRTGRYNNHPRNTRDQNTSFPQVAVNSPIPIAEPIVQEQPPISLEFVAQFAPEQQSLILGERLFPLIEKIQPKLAGKITGMLLDRAMPAAAEELVHLILSPDALNAKIAEAIEVLERHGTTDE